MPTQSRPMTYLSMKAIIPQMSSTQRVRLSLNIPVFQSISKKIPQYIETFRVDREEVRIDKDIYNFKRLMSSFPVAETEFIQFIVNNNRSSLIRTKAPVEVLVKVFLEVVFGEASIQVGTWELGFCPMAKIQLKVDHVKLLGQYFEPVIHRMICRKSLPLKSVEVQWDNVPKTYIDTELFIAPIRSSEHMPIPYASFSNYRMQVKADTEHHRFAAELATWIFEMWEDSAIRDHNHWSFDVDTKFCEEFLERIREPQFDVEIENEQYIVMCIDNHAMALRVFTVSDESTPRQIQLHFKFEHLEEINIYEDEEMENEEEE